jgi:hypothetical protein
MDYLPYPKCSVAALKLDRRNSENKTTDVTRHDNATGRR